MSTSQLPQEARKERAKDLLSLGRISEARDLLSEFCGDDQRDLEMWSLFGTANAYLGRFEDVILACRRSLEIEPDYLPALNGLASALAALGRYDEASVEFENVLRLAPDNPSVLNNYGHAQFLMGHIDDARATLEHAVRIQPHYAEAHFNLGTLLEQSELFSDALREYEQAASLKPGLPGVQERLRSVRERVQGRE